MTRIIFGIGTGVDQFKNPLDYVEQRKKQAFTFLMGAFGAFHCVDGTGGWNGIIEPGITITIYTEASDECARSAAHYLAKLFDQSCIMLVIEHGLAVEFIS